MALTEPVLAIIRNKYMEHNTLLHSAAFRIT